MSKFILSNSLQKTLLSEEVSKRNGYVVSGQFVSDSYSYTCYHKLSIANDNYLAIGGDFVSVIGTVIYDDTIGIQSLRKIYDDFSGDVNRIRDKVLGNGAFIIKKGDIIYIFSEYLALYHIYYAYNEDSLIVSNDLYDVCFLCNNLEVDYDNLIQRILLAGVYCGETEIKGVNCLQDCESININIKTGAYSIESIPVDWRCNEQYSNEEIVSRISDLLKKYAASFAKHYGVPALSSTGGLDNRLNLASFLAVGVKPDLFYGIGNSAITNTYNGDLKIDNYYKTKYDLSLNVISWKNEIPINKDWKDLERQFGFLSVLYGGSKCFNDSYLSIKNKLILFGAFGEIYRIDDNNYLEDINFSDFTLDEYIDYYVIKRYISPEQPLFKDKGRIKEHIKEKLIPICQKWGLDPNHLSPKDDFILWVERMRRGDSNVPNLINRHHYCAFLNAQYSIVKLLTLLHPKDKVDAKFHLDVLMSLYPSIMEIPIFSRCGFRTYDGKTNTMRLDSQDRMQESIKKVLPYTFIKPLRFLKKIMKNGKKKEEDIFDNNTGEIVESILNNHGLVEGKDYSLKQYGRLERSMVLFAQLISIYDSLNIEFKKD